MFDGAFIGCLFHKDSQSFFHHSLMTNTFSGGKSVFVALRTFSSPTMSTKLAVINFLGKQDLTFYGMFEV